MSNKTPPEIGQVKTLAQTRVFHVQQVDLSFSNGQQRQFERLQQHHPAVMVAPIIEDDTILLIREYAVGLEQYELGLVKGLIDPGEDHLAAANRELQEEAGYAAKQLTWIKSLATAPGYLSHRIELILAEDLYPSTRSGDEPEPLEVIPWRLSQLDKLIARDDCNSARTIAALYLINDLLKQRKP